MFWGRANPEAALRAFERDIDGVSSPEARSDLAAVARRAAQVHAAIQDRDRTAAEAALHPLAWHVSDTFTPMPSSYAPLVRSLRQAVRDW